MPDALHDPVRKSGFVVGGCNREAVSAVGRFFELVGERQHPPPLLLAGPSGSGKTALLGSFRDRLGQGAIEALWLTGRELLDRTVERVRRPDPDRRRFFTGTQVVIVDELEALSAAGEIATEAMWQLRHAAEAGVAVAVAETTALFDPATPAIAMFRTLIRSDAAIHRIAPLDPATRGELIRQVCQRRRLHLPESLLSALDDAGLASGAEIEGAVASLHAHADVEPTPLPSVPWDFAIARPHGVGLYKRRLLLNLAWARARSPHDAIGVEPRDFRDMVIVWLLQVDLQATAAELSQAVGRSVGGVVALRELMARHQGEPVVQGFIRSVRP